MTDFLARLPPGDVAPFVFFTLTLAAGLIIWLSWQWRLHRRTELEVTLKQQMVSQGMTADEIERVLHASLSGRKGMVKGDREGQPEARQSYAG
jgi:hypothetical protein